MTSQSCREYQIIPRMWNCVRQAPAPAGLVLTLRGQVGALLAEVCRTIIGCASEMYTQGLHGHLPAGRIKVSRGFLGRSSVPKMPAV